MKYVIAVLFVLSVAIGAPCVLADGSPDAQLNPQTGVIEIADPVWSGDNYDIRYVVAPGEWAQFSDVTTDPADDLRPRMAIAPGGDAYIVWRRDSATPQVLIRKHNADGTWSEEAVLSDADFPGRNPEIAHDGGNPWVAFAEEASSEIRMRVGAIEIDPDPFGSFAQIASTEYEGDVDLRIHAASGHLWVTWTDSDLDLAWAEYDYVSATWSSVDYDSYAGDSTKHALERVRATVLGN